MNKEEAKPILETWKQLGRPTNKHWEPLLQQAQEAMSPGARKEDAMTFAEIWALVDEQPVTKWFKPEEIQRDVKSVAPSTRYVENVLRQGLRAGVLVERFGKYKRRSNEE